MAAKGNIGSVDPTDVERVNALKSANGFANAGEAVALLLDEYEGLHGSIMDEEGNVTLDEGEAAGLTEAKRINARMMKEIERLLVRRHELQEEAVSEQAAKIEELTAQVAERDEVITDRDKTIAEQAAELEDLRKKAESVDALTKAMHEAEEAQAKRFDDMMSMLKAQVERYESDLADAKSAVDHLTAERDAAQAKIDEVEQERGVLAEQVRELQKRLADVDQAKQQ